MKSINYNNQSRHNSLEVPLSDVQPLYAALKKFDDLCYDSNNCVRHKLKPGTGNAFFPLVVWALNSNSQFYIGYTNFIIFNALGL